MKKYLSVVVVLLMVAEVGFSQGYINLSKARVKKHLNKYTKKENLKTVIEETESTITFLVRDSSIRPLDIVLHFDDKGKCDEEVRTFDCDSCAQKYLTKVLSYKSYKWGKISDSQYLSRYSLKRSLVINPVIKNRHSFTIKRYDLKRKDYNLLINNVK